MRFSRLAVLVLALAALALAAVPATAAQPFAFCAQADPLTKLFVATSGPGAQPACGPFCAGFDGGTTPTADALGSSCATATSNLDAQLKDYANGTCSVVAGPACNLMYTTTVACHAVSGGYSVSGYAKYGCRETTC